VGKTWGLQPRAIIWLYTAVVKPSLLYCSIIWWKRTQQETVRNKLNHLQKMVCMGITGATRTDPTLAMETLLNLAPLYVEAEVQARLATYRLKNLGQWHDKDKLSGNRQIWAKIVEPDPSLEMEPDTMVALFNQSPLLFRTHFPLRGRWAEEEGKHLHIGAKVWLNDGSMKDGRAGLAFTVVPPT
jgi:hypothetical protein